jgi:hypothetical protein
VPARSELGPGGRSVAALLALVWIGAGAAAIVLGIRQGMWLRPVLGLCAVAYGALWVQVARTGRRLGWPKRGR